jgi:hypothetical protein
MTNTYKVTLRDGGTFEIEVTAKSCKEMNNNLKEKLTNTFNENNITNVSLMKTVLSREEKMIEDYESAMNCTLSDRDKEMMISVLHWADECYPSDKSIAKYLYEKKGYPISLNGDIPSFEDTMKFLEQYHDYKREQWIDKQSRWHKVADGDLPVDETEHRVSSDEMIVFLEDGCWDIWFFNFQKNKWVDSDGEYRDSSEILYWIALPDLPKKD